MLNNSSISHGIIKYELSKYQHLFSDENKIKYAKLNILSDHMNVKSQLSLTSLRRS